MFKKFIIYINSTRPKFISITVLGVLIGFSIPSQLQNHPTNWLINLTALALAVFAHSAANVINDYYDELNGSDRVNHSRISPFTGGSRFIQNGVLSSKQVKQIGLILFCTVILGGITLSFFTNYNLIWIGLLGIGLGWAYSANPFKLMSRGIWGELAITVCWLLIVIGANLIKNNTITTTSIFQGLAYGLMVSTILLINQIPDIEADKSVSKITLAVEAGANHVWKWFVIILILAYATIIVAYLLNIFTLGNLLTLSSIPLGWRIALTLKNHVQDRSSLTSCIKQTILLTHIVGLLLLISNLWQ